jgi:hypothetical protein
MLCIIELCKNEGSEIFSLKLRRGTMQKEGLFHVFYIAMVATIDGYFHVPTPE